MPNYEELKQRIHSAQKAMDELLEFMEENPYGEDCRKCFKLGTQQASACLIGFMTGMLVGILISVPFATCISNQMLLGGAV